MLLLATVRWVLFRALRSPACFAIPAAALAVPLAYFLSPWIDSHAHESHPELTTGWLAPFGVLGFAYGMRVLSQGEIFLRQFGARERLLALMGGLLAPAVLLQFLVVLSSASLFGLNGALQHLGRAMLLDVRLAVFGLWTWALVAPNWRMAVFLGIAWLLPGLLADGGEVERLGSPFAGWIVSGERMSAFATDWTSALAWLGGYTMWFLAAVLFLIPGRSSRA